MSDYIKREDAINALNGTVEVTGFENAQVVAQLLGAEIRKIKNIPAADVEPVVHCKDCKYIGTCCRNIFTDPISHEITLTYCSVGKRKDGW